MAINPTTQKMGEKHEERLALAFGGARMPGSGNQWHHQTDVRNAHDLPFAFAVDGKSTMGKGITITRDMLDKLIEQAAGERPALGLRWYGSGDLDDVAEDGVYIRLPDWEEVLTAARAYAALEAALGGSFDAARVRQMLVRSGEQEGQMATLREELEEAHRQEGNARLLYAEALKTLEIVQAERDTYREAMASAQSGRLIPATVPRLPWTVVHKINLEDRSEVVGTSYAADGAMTQVAVRTATVERSPDSRNRPRLIVNGIRVPDGDLYVDGKLTARVCDKDPSIEVG